jgi:hypothetical protein
MVLLVGTTFAGNGFDFLLGLDQRQKNVSDIL